MAFRGGGFGGIMGGTKDAGADGHPPPAVAEGVTMVDQKRKPRKIPVIKVPPGTMEAELRAKIRTFEQRYERDSEQMAVLFDLGAVRETGEILEWMFDYRVLQRLEGKETPTDGILGTTSEPSTKGG